MGALLVNHKTKQGYSTSNMSTHIETNNQTASYSAPTSVPECEKIPSQNPEDNPDFATIYIVSQIVLFIIRKCWKSCGLSVLVLVIVYWVCGVWMTVLAVALGISGLLYQVSDWLLYHPEQPSHSRIYIPSPTLFNLPSENFHIRTKDGLMINTIFVKQDQSVFSQVPTILMFHGNAGNIGHRLPIVHGFYKICGCNVLMCEYRGYGRSEGKASEKGFYLDAQAALDYLLQYPGIDREKIIIFGQSLGGAVAIDLASHAEYSKKILLLIIENTFTSIPNMAKVLFNTRLVRILPAWCFKNQFCSGEKIQRVCAPTLFISGLADSLIPPHMMDELYKSCKSHLKRLLLFQSGTHNETWQCHGYFRTVGLFIDDVILFMYDQKRTGEWPKQEVHVYIPLDVL